MVYQTIPCAVCSNVSQPFQWRIFFFNNIWPKLLLVQLEAFSSCPVACWLVEETDPHLTVTSFEVIVTYNFNLVSLSVLEMDCCVVEKGENSLSFFFFFFSDGILNVCLSIKSPKYSVPQEALKLTHYISRALHALHHFCHKHVWNHITSPDEQSMWLCYLYTLSRTIPFCTSI